MSLQTKLQIGIDHTVKKVISIALIVILLFSTGYISGALTNVNIKKNEATGDQTDVVATTADTTEASTSQDDTTEQISTSSSPVTTTAPSEATTVTDALAEAVTSTVAAPAPGVPSTTEEIVALFNEAVNKVKIEATKITRNFKNTRYDTEKSVLPSALQSMANPMVEKYVKDDPEPVEYLTKEEIIENFPVPKQEYSSKLSAADVTSAVCTDNGTEYEITINLATSINPTAGVGVGAACHFMDVSSIVSSEAASSMLKKFDATYEGCVIKCKIDKASNRVTWANYYTPFCIDAIVNVVLSEVQTTVYMSYERDYTITY